MANGKANEGTPTTKLVMEARGWGRAVATRFMAIMDSERRVHGRPVPPAGRGHGEEAHPADVTRHH